MLRICWLACSQSKKERNRMMRTICAGCAPAIQAGRPEQIHLIVGKKTCLSSSSSRRKTKSSCSCNNDNRPSTRSRANPLRILSRCHQSQSSLIAAVRHPKWTSQLSREAKVQLLKLMSWSRSIQQAAHRCHLLSTLLSCRWPLRKTKVCNSLCAPM